ncbi:hypothetical protein K501DRAFT_288321 [Backusella circina FSU 941]|nr:hypothetical protein K501DRAFT_288321 [Backusella circina FSU 941]
MPEACKNADFRWIASDRNYWDGWASKSMFLRKDGQFTRKDINILENEEICVLVLLGPIPAVSAIKPTLHYASSDAIVLTASSDTGVFMTIPLQQHDQQSNVYFASAHFAFDGQYILDTSVEYRSYFWENPMMHHYRPNRFSSRNKLNAMKRFSQEQLPICTGPSLQGAWMSKVHLQQRDPLRYYDEYATMFGDMTDSSPVYVPSHCRFNHTMDCLESKTIHVWGDKHTKRNLQLLKDDHVWCNDAETCMCNETDDPNLTNADSTIEFGMNTKIQFTYTPMVSSKFNDLKTEMMKSGPEADIVILGVGNEDFGLTIQNPSHFAIAFKSLLLYTISHYHQSELIVVRTPQYFGKDDYGAEKKWNTGLSMAFANIVRSTVANLSLEQKSRVILWDTHQLGSNENICKSNLLSNQHLVQLENELLLTLVCNAS